MSICKCWLLQACSTGSSTASAWVWSQKHPHLSSQSSKLGRDDVNEQRITVGEKSCTNDCVLKSFDIHIRSGHHPLDCFSWARGCWLTHRQSQLRSQVHATSSSMLFDQSHWPPSIIPAGPPRPPNQCQWSIPQGEVDLYHLRTTVSHDIMMYSMSQHVSTNRRRNLHIRA